MFPETFMNISYFQHNHFAPKSLSKSVMPTAKIISTPHVKTKLSTTVAVPKDTTLMRTDTVYQETNAVVMTSLHQLNTSNQARRLALDA